MAHLADLRNEQSFKEAVSERTRVVYFETPVNPTLDLIDIALVRRWMDEVRPDREVRPRAETRRHPTFNGPGGLARHH